MIVVDAVVACTEVESTGVFDQHPPNGPSRLSHLRRDASVTRKRDRVVFWCLFCILLFLFVYFVVSRRLFVLFLASPRAPLLDAKRAFFGFPQRGDRVHAATPRGRESVENHKINHKFSTGDHHAISVSIKIAPPHNRPTRSPNDRSRTPPDAPIEGIFPQVHVNKCSCCSRSTRSSI